MAITIPGCREVQAASATEETYVKVLTAALNFFLNRVLTSFIPHGYLQASENGQFPQQRLKCHGQVEYRTLGRVVGTGKTNMT